MIAANRPPVADILVADLRRRRAATDQAAAPDPAPSTPGAECAPVPASVPGERGLVSRLVLCHDLPLPRIPRLGRSGRLSDPAGSAAAHHSGTPSPRTGGLSPARSPSPRHHAHIATAPIRTSTPHSALDPRHPRRHHRPPHPRRPAPGRPPRRDRPQVRRSPRTTCAASRRGVRAAHRRPVAALPRPRRPGAMPIRRPGPPGAEPVRGERAARLTSP